MSTEVDQKIVEMQFNNANFEKNVQTSIGTLDKLKKSLNLESSAKSFASLDKEVKGFSMSSLASSVETIAGRFTNLGIIGVTALQNITNSAVNAGKRILSALTIEPITTGFNEYELKMGSIQTIMASTGESLDSVNSYLAELNEYSDRTIYSFSDMTSNIGKFTNAGVKLEDAVAAIKGVSNVAAVSGANAGEASRAMYNFAQALSAGYVKLIDWKSIENANMATVEFKNYLLESAVAAGTLTKTADGMYKTLEKGTVIDATHNFNDSLQEQWMTTETLVNSLKDYADETTEIGKKAYASAQDIKTFSQLFDTLKESAQSGWGQTWELLIGDFEEAKALLTQINDVVSGILSDSANARNTLLQGWKDLGGRTVLIEGLQIALSNIGKILESVGTAFRSVFPKMTAQQLMDFTNKFKEFAGKLEMSNEAGKNFRNTLRGLFSFIKMVGEGIGKIVKFILPFASTLTSLAGSILDITGPLGLSLKKVTVSEDALSGLTTILEKFTSIIDNATQKVKNFFSSFSISIDFSKLVDLFGKLSEKMGKVGSAITSLNFDKLMGIFNTGVLAAGMTGLLKLISKISKGFSSIDGAIGKLDKIKDALTGLVDVFEGNLKAQTLKNLAIAIGILAASMFVLSLVDAEKMGSALIGMTTLFAELFGFIALFGKLNAGFENVTKATVLMTGMAVAILILSGAMAILASIDPEKMTNSLMAIAVLMMELAIFMKFADFSKIGLRSSAGILILASALVVLAGALALMSLINPEKMTTALMGLAIVLMEIAVAMNFMPKNMLQIGAGLMAVSIGLTIISGALLLIGKLMTMDEAITALATLGGALAILAVGLNKMNGSLSGSAALLVASAAIMVLTPALLVLGHMSLESLAKGLGTIAAAFIILGVSAKVLAPLTPIILSLAGSLALIGVGILALGVGVIALSAGITVLGIAVSTGSAGIMAGISIIVLGFVNLIPQIVTALLNNLSSIITAAVALITAFLLGIKQTIPLIIIVGLDILTALLTGIANNIYQIASQAILIVANFINAISSMLPAVINAGMGLVISFINGVAEAIRGNSKPLFEAIRNVLSSIIELVITGLQELVSLIPGVGPQLAADMEGWKTSIQSVIAPESMASIGAEAGDGIGKSFTNSLEATPTTVSATKLGDDFVAGIKAKEFDATSAGLSLGNNTSDGLKSPDYVSSGEFGGQGFVEGLNNKWWDAYYAGYNLGEAAKQGEDDAMRNGSPSKEMRQRGIFAGQGLVNGLVEMATYVYSAGHNLGTTILKSLTDPIARISEVIDSDIDYEPTIRPVLDLSKIESDAGKINTIFSNKATLSIAKITDSASIAMRKERTKTSESETGTKTEASKVVNNNFTQNNYSPKALSRLDIYRQTRNQLSAVKGLVNT